MARLKECSLLRTDYAPVFGSTATGAVIIAESAAERLELLFSGIDDDVEVKRCPRLPVKTARYRAGDHVGDLRVFQQADDSSK